MAQNISTKLFYADSGHGRGLCLTFANGEITVASEDLKGVYNYITLEFIQKHFPAEMVSDSVRYAAGSDRCITEGINKGQQLMGKSVR